MTLEHKSTSCHVKIDVCQLEARPSTKCTVLQRTYLPPIISMPCTNRSYPKSDLSQCSGCHQLTLAAASCSNAKLISDHRAWVPSCISNPAYLSSLSSFGNAPCQESFAAPTDAVCPMKSHLSYWWQSPSKSPQCTKPVSSRGQVHTNPPLRHRPCFREASDSYFSLIGNAGPRLFASTRIKVKSQPLWLAQRTSLSTGIAKPSRLPSHT